MLKYKKYRAKLTFIKEVLGTVPKNKQVFSDYVATRTADDAGEPITPEQIENETGMVPTATDNGQGYTGFMTVDVEGTERVGLAAYMVKGFFKEACASLKRASEKTERGQKSDETYLSNAPGMKAYKKIVDGNIFIEPDLLLIERPDNAKPLEAFERPLRASTPLGDRVALAKSDEAEKGSYIEFEIIVLGVVSEELLREWFNYGYFRGLGQFRNARFGAFTYELEYLGEFVGNEPVMA